MNESLALLRRSGDPAMDQRRHGQGASVGLYDPNYISKLRGLKALSDVTSNNEKISGGLRVEVLNNDTAKRMQALAKVAKKRENTVMIN